MKLQAVKGTFDILPEEQSKWRFVYEVAQRVLEHAGVQELSPPIFEHSEVFTKSVGESADLVVQKEMYSFTDLGGRSLTLRPEFTAGVMRAFIEHGMQMCPSPIKLWSRGPAFRAEKPQKGRYRQFHQINCEILGLKHALVDAEAIALLYQIFSELGLKNLLVKLGSVGDPPDRKAYNQYLREQLGQVQDKLSEVSRERLKLNPMRVLDSKDEGDQAIVRELKRPLDFIGAEARAHFEEVKSYLRNWDIPFEIDDSIVRGLDYYNRTAFEFHHGDIGSQSALCGGGRYDGLVENMGGPKTPGVGWAFGIERVLLALEQDRAELPTQQRLALFLIPMDDEAVAEVAKFALGLRQRFSVEHAYTRRNPGKGLKEADRAGAVFAALRGSKEREAGSYQLKHLASGEQITVSQTQLADFLAARL